MSRIGILGAGAVGQLIAHQLASAGTLPFLLDRQLTAITEPYSLTDLNGNRNTLNFAKSNDKQALLGELDLLIITVKAYQVIDAVTGALPGLSPHCHLLLLHNGLGPHEEVAALLDGRGLTLGTTSQGALRLGKHDLKQTGSGLTQLGHCTGPAMAPGLKTLLLSAIPGSEWVEAILPALWQKLAVNACINPLTAIHGICNGELADNAYQATIAGVLRELVEVARTQGIELQEESLSARVYEVIRLTAANRSSMRQDVDHKRKTEIDAINGYLVSLGHRHSIATPTNRALVDAIHTLERRF
ncbi:ketopantoate reductase family protein [Shewanella amazonensis]|uniref:2-dehydropantoate 2-reductase n=1 Tax=Shewanella amazonensis (strain ATCC BAA-1098 / SB2B) TaxID=326297 RepID=A1S8Q5_SHEAM|nr:2-dehydropantoate 2-reductase [Shewanella amazonensis]ABM00762.1 2-dehydropantoate 2-reductase [Shewanella amazonensis SB2B]